MKPKRMNLGIIGCGIIGESLAKLLEDMGHFVQRYDPAKLLGCDITLCEIVFICVPTEADMKFEDVKSAVSYTNNKNKRGIIAIRSTIMPGMTDEFAKQYKREFVYMPEFLRERTAFLDEICPDKIIIGTKKKKIFEIFRGLFKRVPDKKNKIMMMKTVEAELLKLSLNSLYVIKVVFGNELYEICQKYEADYYKLFEAFKLDKYINAIHLDPLFDGYRGAGGKCLPKDIKFLIQAAKEKEVFPGVMLMADKQNTDLLDKWGSKQNETTNQ
jgi:UDPglucose 6-dehydrogenase